MIKIEDLRFSYSKHKVFDNISLSLSRGNVYGLLGQNGVGKSTLLKIIAGLLKADKGSCLIDNSSSYKREPNFLKNIYYVAENFVGPAIKVGSFANEYGKFYPNYSPSIFNEIIDIFEIDQNSLFTHLSYGQQKKAIIAFAFSLQTQILLLDEPTNGLDIPSKGQLRRVIVNYSNDDSIIIISTHQVRDLENIIDPIIILDKEGIVLNASLETISKQLYFSLDTIKNIDALYSENVPGGYSQVKINTDGIESQVNIEALFNSVLLHKQKINQIFNQQ